MDTFLRWSHPDLLEERLLHCAAIWQVLEALAIDPAAVPPPARGPVSPLTWNGLSLLISSARVQPDRPTVFNLGSSTATALLLCLLEPGEAPADPQDPAQWLFWLVPRQRFHAERQSIGLQPLLRAQGEGLSREQLADALAQLAAEA
jgi:hypothetical protein